MLFDGFGVPTWLQVGSKIDPERDPKVVRNGFQVELSKKLLKCPKWLQKDPKMTPQGIDFQGFWGCFFLSKFGESLFSACLPEEKQRKEKRREKRSRKERKVEESRKKQSREEKRRKKSREETRREEKGRVNNRR